MREVEVTANIHIFKLLALSTLSAALLFAAIICNAYMNNKSLTFESKGSVLPSICATLSDTHNNITPFYIKITELQANNVLKDFGYSSLFNVSHSTDGSYNLNDHNRLLKGKEKFTIYNGEIYLSKVSVSESGSYATNSYMYIRVGKNEIIEIEKLSNGTLKASLLVLDLGKGYFNNGASTQILHCLES